MNFFIQLKYGFCPKSVCSRYGQCNSVTNNLAYTKSLNVPCLTYGFAEVVSTDIESNHAYILDLISVIQQIENQENN